MKYPYLQPDMKEEFMLRIDKVKSAMKETGCDSLLIASTTNLFYLSGIVFRGYVLVSLDRHPVWFMVPPSVSPEDAENTVNIHKPEMIPDWMREHSFTLPKKIGLEYDDLLYSELMRLKRLFPEAETVNGSTVMRQARMVKTEYEIGRIREDGMHHARVYGRVPGCYKSGMTDLELQIEVEHVLRLEGCLGYLRAAGSRMELNLG